MRRGGAVKERILQTRWWMIVRLVLVASVLSGLCAFAPAAQTAASPFDLIPGTPIPSSPQHESWAKTADVTFDWSSVSGAATYEFRYAKTATCMVDPMDADPDHIGQFAAIDADIATTSEPTKRIEGLADGTWCWQVRAVSLFGFHGAWSEIRQVKIDTHAPVVEVKMPLALPQVSGTIDANTAMMVPLLDGVQRPDILVRLASIPDETGAFEWSMTLPEGWDNTHTTAIKAIDTAGNETMTAIGSGEEDPAKLPVKPVGNIVKTDVLPLVSEVPLALISAPSSLVATDGVEPPVVVVDNHIPEKITNAPQRIEALATKHTITYENPLQATNQGWTVFGVAWYWWALGGSMGVGAWTLLARARLGPRLD